MRKPAASVVTRPAPALPESSAPGDTLVRTFNELRDELVSTLWFLLGNPEDAQDAAQEAFLRCWRAQDDVPGIHNLRAWIFRVALNVAKDVQRSAWRRRAKPLLGTEIMPIIDDAAPTQDLEDQETLTRLRQALLQLRPEEKEVF